MNANKHICAFNCEEKGECFYRHSSQSSRSESGSLVCYYDYWIENLHKPIEVKKDLTVIQLRIQRKENKSSENKITKDGEVVRCSNIYCGTTERITQHHLVPNPYRKGIAGANRKIPLCWTCHSRVHRLRTNKQLAMYFNTKQTVLELLAEDIKFRLSRMMITFDSLATPKQEMTIVSLNNVPRNEMVMAAAG